MSFDYTVYYKSYSGFVLHCFASFFKIYDGPDMTSTVLFDGFGYEVPEPVYSSGSTLTINFLTNSFWTKQGVCLVWKGKFKI